LRVSEISATGFRNLSPAPVVFGPGMTLLVGENAQGKTNLLEAVALLCGQRSFRGATAAEMASGDGGFCLRGTLRQGFETTRLTMAWAPHGGRSFERDGSAVSFREVSRLAPAVFLAPDHRELICGSPALRRRFVDRLLLASRPAAGDDLARYDRALRNRNALLARVRMGGSVPADELAAWTEELVRAGSVLRRKRREALASWRELFLDLARDAGREYAAVSVSYESDGDTEEDLRRACEVVAAAERRRGHSLAGPHRDDLAWTRDGRPLASRASSGEIHRTVALAKLAEWKAVARATGETPLFGVDDFDAGLSAGWAEAFFDALPEGVTAILTTASDPARWRRWSPAIVEMRAGRAVERGSLRAANG
jgi:DNA replication and repair protein RecF